MEWDSSVAELTRSIRDVPDFPKPGIVFKDITPLLGDARALRRAADLLTTLVGHLELDRIVAIESRGFILGGLLADRLGVGFVPVRKPGKLPYKRIRAEYELEYGKDVLEIHADALRAGERVLIVDDVIATGGTAAATAQLVEQLGASVAAFAFLVELSFLNGRGKLGSREVLSLIRY